MLNFKCVIDKYSNYKNVADSIDFISRYIRQNKFQNKTYFENKSFKKIKKTLELYSPYFKCCVKLIFGSNLVIV